MAWGDWIWLCYLTIRKIFKRGCLREKKLKSFFGRLLLLSDRRRIKKALHFMEIPDNISFWEVSIKKVGMWRMS